ncbi:adenylate/guanylate cyclase domain-containing protein [Skermanella pratensis]|uniref:adenylate/guanylate cyclase domain-containing protein n=1 Tax=Skermanella pratensis TaxID=2233999 RepID=UPI0013016190|nr:adenylate/guanylate cyclase domain-containing protein [Skermanella pratensis]
MEDRRILELSEWIIGARLEGAPETELVDGFCRRLVEYGVPLTRVVVGIDTLHPVLEARTFHWHRKKNETTASEYARAVARENEDKWLKSPFYYLTEGGGKSLRCRFVDGDCPSDRFPVLGELRDEGITDYLAISNMFGKPITIGLMDSLVSSWSTGRPEGFDDTHITIMERSLPFLALAIRDVSVARIAETLVETYLGRDAGRRVLGGYIERGVTERMSAVLWFSDLQGFTRITDTVDPEQVIPLLNDYADAIVSSIHDHQGQVMKFMGDGIMAIFSGAGDGELCNRSLDAAEEARRRVARLNKRRKAEGLPWTRFYLGLNVGEVFYGNIGSEDRLDFTVIGPAVNEVSRIAAMCRSLDQDVLLSSAFANSAETCAARLVSVGRYALRGVGRPQELFTLDPEAVAGGTGTCAMLR